jgi:hypothetical protein
MDENVYEGGWLPEVGNKPPEKKINYGLLLLGTVAIYYLLKKL